MANTIRLDYRSRTIKEDLAQLPEKMLEYSLEAINDAADLIVGLAKVYVRVDTGSLRDSIRKERVGPTYRQHRVVRVRAGGYIINPKTGKLVNYAAIIEAKYPFLRPAFLSVYPQIKSMIENKVVEGVNSGR
jgi:hypothetical protein